MRMLSKPTLFEISESGKVSSLRISEEEAEWSINFKKALVALFQTGLDEARGISPMSSSGLPTVNAPRMWTTYEQAPDGECETKYEMVEVPASVAGTASEEVGELSIPKVEYCQPDAKIYQLTKTRNLDNCVRTAVFNFYKPGHLTCMPHEMRGVPMTSWKQAPYSLASGSCGSLWSRSSVTRYAVCGSPDHFLVQSVINEGEVNRHLMNYKSEKMLTGTRQSIKLLSKQSSSASEGSLLSSSGSTVEISSLLYSYSKKTRSGLNSQSVGPVSVHEIMEEMMGNGERISPEELVRKTEMLVKEVIQHDLANPTILPEAEMSWKVLKLSSTFKMFDRTMLRRVYENVVGSVSGEEKDIAKNILVDTIVMSGTPEAIKFFKDLVERRELRNSQISAIFFALPRTIVTPTSYLLEELFELIKSEPMKEQTKVWNMAILSFSGLLEKACISPVAKENYPTQVYGKFCHKDSSIVTQRWIPYLRSELYKREMPVERKNAIIVSLGLLSHEQILPIVLDVLEGNIASPAMRQEHNYHTVRYLSVYSLVSIGRFQPHKVLPIVSAIYSNKAEPTDIRLAAFNVIMALNPDMALLQKIATLTWSEKNTEVLRAVNTAFYTLATRTSMQDFATDLSVLIRRARIIYPLIKKTGGRVPSTATVFASEFLTMLKVGYERTVNWVHSEDSVIPSYLYDKTVLFMGEEYKYTFMETGLHQRDILPTLYDTISGLTHTSSEEIKSKLSNEWREAIEKLRIKVRENRTPEAYVYMKLFEDSTLFWSLSTRSVEHLKNILKNPSLLKSTLSGESNFNWQRVVDLSPYEHMVPSDLGMPIFAEVRMPTVASVRGRFSSDIMRSSEGLSKVDTTFEVLVDRRVTGRVGTIIPFTGEYVYTGIDEKIYGGGPSMDIHVRLDIPNGKLSASLKFPEQKWNKDQVEFVGYKVRPYTVIQKYFDMTPVFKSAGFKIIKSRTPKHSREYEFGQYSGIDMKLVYNTETPYLGYDYLLKKLRNMNYNPINMFRFTGVDALSVTATGLPSVRHHESKLVVLPHSSSTKEVEFVLKWGVATKEKGQPMLYHIMKPSENTLFKIVSKPVGEMREQPRRQEMVKSMMEKLQVNFNMDGLRWGVTFFMFLTLLSDYL